MPMKQSYICGMYDFNCLKENKTLLILMLLGQYHLPSHLCVKQAYIFRVAQSFPYGPFN